MDFIISQNMPLRLTFQNMISGPLSYRVFRETGPRNSISLTGIDISPGEHSTWGNITTVNINQKLPIDHKYCDIQPLSFALINVSQYCRSSSSINRFRLFLERKINFLKEVTDSLLQAVRSYCCFPFCLWKLVLISS